MSILKDFISMVESESDSVDIRKLFKNDEERLRWEKMVEVFEEIQIDRIKEGMLSVSEKYKLSRDEEVNIMAYIKFLELMVIKMDALKKDTLNGSEVSSISPPPNASKYEGGMFG